jgi:hypothetical protein
LREVSKELAARNFLNERGKPYAAKSVAQHVGLTSGGGDASRWPVEPLFGAESAPAARRLSIRFWRMADGRAAALQFPDMPIAGRAHHRCVSSRSASKCCFPLRLCQPLDALLCHLCASHHTRQSPAEGPASTRYRVRASAPICLAESTEATDGKTHATTARAGQGCPYGK